jgi:cation diffusion facilitator family transporter
MQLSKNFEYPKPLEEKFRKAKRLQWITTFYFMSSAIFIAFIMGTSQTMKTAWIEDVMSIISSVSFLATSKIYVRETNENFPYGYHRVTSIAYLISAVTLAAFGLYLVADSGIKLIKAEYPTVSTMVVAGREIWMGYFMIIALLYSTIPSMILGLKKLPLSIDLSEKNLYTDSDMNKADWLSGIAAIAGIIGIGIGWWWADSVAALIISTDILYDGFSNLKHAVLDLMNQAPKTLEEKEPEPILEQIKKEVERETWVKEAGIRFRQEGHVLFGEIFIVPSDESNITMKLDRLRERLLGMDWRVFDITIMPVRKL